MKAMTSAGTGLAGFPMHAEIIKSDKWWSITARYIVDGKLMGGFSTTLDTRRDCMVVVRRILAHDHRSTAVNLTTGDCYMLNNAGEVVTV